MKEDHYSMQIIMHFIYLSSKLRLFSFFLSPCPLSKSTCVILFLVFVMLYERQSTQYTRFLSDDSLIWLFHLLSMKFHTYWIDSWNEPLEGKSNVQKWLTIWGVCNFSWQILLPVFPASQAPLFIWWHPKSVFNSQTSGQVDKIYIYL